jgi:hypothetical protein
MKRARAFIAIFFFSTMGLVLVQCPSPPDRFHPHRPITMRWVMRLETQHPKQLTFFHSFCSYLQPESRHWSPNASLLFISFQYSSLAESSSGCAVQVSPHSRELYSQKY